MTTEHPAIDRIARFEQMLLVRAYEEAIVAGSTAGKVPGTCNQRCQARLNRMA